MLEELAARVSPRVLAAPAPARRAAPRARPVLRRRAGTRSTLPLDWRLTDGFARRVLAGHGRRSPTAGSPATSEVAAAAGSPRGFRAAGNALGSNPLPIVVPCHRVLHSGGGLGGYTGGLERKRTLLAIERGLASAR